MLLHAHPGHPGIGLPPWFILAKAVCHFARHKRRDNRMAGLYA